MVAVRVVLLLAVVRVVPLLSVSPLQQRVVALVVRRVQPSRRKALLGRRHGLSLSTVMLGTLHVVGCVQAMLAQLLGAVGAP